MNTVTLPLADYLELKEKAEQLNKVSRENNWVRLICYRTYYDAFVKLTDAEREGILPNEIAALQEKLNEAERKIFSLEVELKSKPAKRRLKFW